MRRKIFRNMCLLAGGVSLLAYTFIFLVLYNVFDQQTEKDINNETYYLANIMNKIESDNYRNEMLESFNDGGPYRITWIAGDGIVIYDNQADISVMDNHKSRPEVEEALKSGSAIVKRHSPTLKEWTYYSAMRLEDGTVIRVSITTDSIYAMYLSSLPALLGILGLLCLIVLYMANRVTNSIVRPINKIDLEKPEYDIEVYDELRPMLERIRHQNDERKKNEKLRREFSANVSHELKTPLTSISGYAEIMKSGIVDPKDVPEFAEKIYKEAARLIDLVNDIIKISGLDERKIGIEKENCDLLDIALEVKNRLEAVAAKNKVIIQVHGKSVKTMAVAQMIEELFYNLCENAIKYNHSGGRVTVTIGREGGRARIEILDTGIGIPREHQNRVFERFYRVDKSHSRVTGGTGLGLAIVKHVVEYHDGDIVLSSEEGKWTKIVVLLG